MDSGVNPNETVDSGAVVGAGAVFTPEGEAISDGFPATMNFEHFVLRLASSPTVVLKQELKTS